MSDGELGVVAEVRSLGMQRWLARTLDGVTMLVRGDARVALRTFSCERSEALLAFREDRFDWPLVTVSESPLASDNFTPLSDGVCEQGGVG